MVYRQAGQILDFDKGFFYGAHMQSLGRSEVESLYELMVASRKVAALDYMRKLIEIHGDNNLILSEVLNPALIMIGNAWGQRRISLSQSFVCAKIAEEILSECASETPAYRNENLKAVIGNIEGDYSITFRDTGSGIPQEHLESIFQPFKQVDSANNRRPRGTGLGLAIVKSLVSSMRGSISIESEVDKGTSIRVNLPVT